MPVEVSNVKAECGNIIFRRQETKNERRAVRWEGKGRKVNVRQRKGREKKDGM